MSASMAAEGWQLDAAALPVLPRTYVQHNFTSFYSVDTEGSPGHDLAFRLHANGLCGELFCPAAGAATALAATPVPSGCCVGPLSVLA